MRGVVRVENVEHPAQYVPAVLRRTQPKHIERTYEIKHADYNDDSIEFLSIIARKGGRLLKGGEADVDGVAKMILNDFLRGKIPWFTPVPKSKSGNAEDDATEVVEGREGRLGEMPNKRKADMLSDIASIVQTETDADRGVEIDTRAEFESFSDDSAAQDDLLESDLDEEEDGIDDDDSESLEESNGPEEGA